MSDETKSTIENPAAVVDLPPRDGGFVVPLPTAASAQAAVDATLDSADEADMREILNTQGDLHERGSSEANAETIRANAKTADEIAVTKAVADLESQFEEELDKQMDAILSSPAVDAMLQAALEDAADDEAELGGVNPNAQTLLSLTNQRVTALEQKVAAFETILVQFRERALAAFKHAGFKF